MNLRVQKSSKKENKSKQHSEILIGQKDSKKNKIIKEEWGKKEKYK
jgi:hypothetical protein